MTEGATKKDERGTIKLAVELHKEMAHYAVDEGITLAEVCRRGMVALKNKGAKSNVPAECGKNTPTVNVDPNHTDVIKSHGIDIKESELPWVQGLLNVIRGRNSDAKMAIIANIVAFAGYSTAVPEVGEDAAPSDSNALRRRLAEIDAARQLLDPKEAGRMGSPHSPPGPGEAPHGRTPRRTSKAR